MALRDLRQGTFLFWLPWKFFSILSHSTDFSLLRAIQAHTVDRALLFRLLHAGDRATSPMRNVISHTHTAYTKFRPKPLCTSIIFVHCFFFLRFFAWVCVWVSASFISLFTSSTKFLSLSLSIRGVSASVSVSVYAHNVNARANVSNYPKMNEAAAARMASKQSSPKKTLNWSLNEKIDRTSNCCIHFAAWFFVFHFFSLALASVWLWFVLFSVSVHIHIYFGDADVDAAAC